MIVSIDGELVAPERAVISVFDRGLLYGEGAFEVLRTYRGRAIDLDRHLARLVATASELGFAAPSLAAHVLATVAAAGSGDHRVRIVVTGGPGALGAARQPGRAIVIVEPLPPQPKALALAIVDHPVRAPSRKTLAYLDHLVALELARAAGADEAVRLDGAGRVIEGSTSNLFVVANGAIATPPLADGPLPGIVRRRILEFGAIERSLAITDLRDAEEIFVTSSLRGVVGVTRLDGQARRVGPTTERVAAMYDAWMTAG